MKIDIQKSSRRKLSTTNFSIGAFLRSLTFQLSLLIVREDKNIVTIMQNKTKTTTKRQGRSCLSRWNHCECGHIKSLRRNPENWLHCNDRDWDRVKTQGAPKSKWNSKRRAETTISALGRDGKRGQKVIRQKRVSIASAETLNRRLETYRQEWERQRLDLTIERIGDLKIGEDRSVTYLDSAQCSDNSTAKMELC